MASCSFHAIQIYSALLYATLSYSTKFYSIILWSVLFYAVLFYSIICLSCSILFYAILLYSIMFEVSFPIACCRDVWHCLLLCLVAWCVVWSCFVFCCVVCIVLLWVGPCCFVSLSTWFDPVLFYPVRFRSVRCCSVLSYSLFDSMLFILPPAWPFLFHSVCKSSKTPSSIVCRLPCSVVSYPPLLFYPIPCYAVRVDCVVVCCAIL